MIFTEKGRSEKNMIFFLRPFEFITPTIIYRNNGNSFIAVQRAKRVQDIYSYLAKTFNCEKMIPQLFGISFYLGVKGKEENRILKSSFLIVWP